MATLYLNQRLSPWHVVPGGVGVVLALTFGKTPFASGMDFVWGVVAFLGLWATESAFYFGVVLMNRVPLHDTRAGALASTLWEMIHRVLVPMVFAVRCAMLATVESLAVLSLLSQFGQWDWDLAMQLLTIYVPVSVLVHVWFERKHLRSESGIKRVENLGGPKA